MARTVRDARLESRTARAALKPSGKPYFRAVDEGLHLGYRKGKTSGKWVLRHYAGGQKYVVETIGTADDTLDPDGAVILSFAQAQAAARKRFLEAKRIAAGLPVEVAPYRVRDAVNEYIAWLEQNRKSARDARWRVDALILPQLGDILCTKLTTTKVRSWRDDIANSRARIRTKKGEAPRFRAKEDDDDPDEAVRRRRSTANRTLTILKAALNLAWRERKIPSDDAWRPVTAFKEVDAARVRYLTVAEAQRLLNAATPEFRRLLQSALLTGARFGELGSVLADDFNPDSGTVHIRKSKVGKDRHIVLTEEGADFFKAMVAGKAGRDRILVKDDGNRWGKSHQTRPMKETSGRAKIDPPLNFHCLRHTYASLTIMGGAPLMVVARNLGHSDTRMVEQHYGHLAPSYVADEIRKAAPRFGIKAEGNVVAIGTGS